MILRLLLSCFVLSWVHSSMPSGHALSSPSMCTPSRNKGAARMIFLVTRIYTPGLLMSQGVHTCHPHLSDLPPVLTYTRFCQLGNCGIFALNKFVWTQGRVDDFVSFCLQRRHSNSFAFRVFLIMETEAQNSTGIRPRVARKLFKP